MEVNTLTKYQVVATISNEEHTFKCTFMFILLVCKYAFMKCNSSNLIELLQSLNPKLLYEKERHIKSDKVILSTSTIYLVNKLIK